MYVYQVENEWTMENLCIAERPVPSPKDGQVRIKMLAAALNYHDLLVPRRGYGRRMQELPLIMLSDGVGVVEAVGAGVTCIRVGGARMPVVLSKLAKWRSQLLVLTIAASRVNETASAEFVEKRHTYRPKSGKSNDFALL
jgi:NADPH:quinone reductase-like Zn-dependent oxidoreductase